MIILTGEKHAGKTSLILQLVEKARVQGLRVAGIACPGLWQQGQRSGFELLELDTGRQALLSRRVAGLRPIPYMFQATSLESGYQALSAKRCQNAELVVVDEVGKLELQGEGWAQCLSPLLELQRPLQIWVVRRSLAREVQELFAPGAEVLDIEAENSLSLLMELVHCSIRKRNV
ncbi:MAG: nucleoside-triphosphatase [Desulfohalobiaceae bacterium]